MKKDLADLRSDNAKMLQQIVELVSVNTQLQEDNKKLNNRVSDLERKIDDLEARSKRNNLIFYGIPDKSGSSAEDCEETLKSVLKEKMGVQGVTFDRVHRIRTNRTPQPMIARFTFYKERQRVLQEKKKLKGSSLFISEDFPNSIREIREKLKPTLTSARKDNKRSFMVYDHLIIEGQRWDYDPVSDSVKCRGRHNKRD